MRYKVSVLKVLEYFDIWSQRQVINHLINSWGAAGPCENWVVKP